MDGVGLVWNQHDSDWDNMFAQLKQYMYRAKHGDWKVPQRGSDPQLGRWVVKQRAFKKKQDQGQQGEGPVTVMAIENILKQMANTEQSMACILRMMQPAAKIRM